MISFLIQILALLTLVPTVQNECPTDVFHVRKILKPLLPPHFL